MVFRWMVFVLMGLCASCGTSEAVRTVEPVQAPESAPVEAEAKSEVFYARFTAPCGRSLLEVSKSPEGPFVAAQATGEQSPIKRLNYRVLVGSGFKVRGRLTGSFVDDGHCGSYPTFAVESFEPWGPVLRIFSQGSIDPGMQMYTEALPKDRFVPEDFVDGPDLRMLDADACKPKSAADCPEGTVTQTETDGDGTVLCCPFIK